jgi:chromosome partitioning protein
MGARVFAIANQKGGVAKTTTTLTLASALTERGLAVLAVDLDPQACLTFSLGYDPDELGTSLHHVVAGESPLAKAVVQHEETDLVPAAIDLAGSEVALLSRTGREYLLRGELRPLLDTYDVVLLDCPPSLGVLTLNALTAADGVVVPVQCETLSHRGVSQLLETVRDVQRLTNPDLAVAGIVATMFDGRTKLAGAVLDDVRRRYGLALLGVPVRKSVRFAEAPSAGVSVLGYDGTVPGAWAYRIIAAELAGLPVAEGWRARAGSP